MRPLVGIPLKHSIQFLSSNIITVRRPDLSYFVNLRNKSDKCCKDAPETEVKKVEVWPRPENKPKGYKMYKSCSKPEDQPPNYDPYRIKMPNVVVPPLPPSNAKPAIECAKAKGPCAVLPQPPDPPCPPPPRKRFPWRYLLPPLLLFAFMGILYKFMLWRNKHLKEQEYHANQISGCVKTKMRPPTPAEDLPPCVQYLIIGAGTAGWGAYLAIKKNDPKAKVFFVTRESTYPYELPPLSKYMWFNPDPPDVKELNYTVNGHSASMYTCDCKDFLEPIAFAHKKVGPAVSIGLGCAATKVDPDEHVATVKTARGERQIYYERCLLAPGSKPKHLDVFKTAPRDVRNRVTYLRTIKDFDSAFRRVKRAKHVTIVGGGILGSELAFYLGTSYQMQGSTLSSFTDDESETEFLHIFKDKGILSGIIPEYLSEWAAERIKCPHVKIKPLTQVYDAFTTEDGRIELCLSDGSTVITDHILVSVGHEPRVDVARASALELDPDNGGILVNAEMQARTHLFVAGDAASYYNQKKQVRMRCEHYDNALQSGNVAGMNMTGYWTVNNAEPHWWLKLGNELQMEVIGEVGACMPTVGIWKQCEGLEEPTAARDSDDTQTDRPKKRPRVCYEDPNYEARYEKGIIFYLQDETIVGVALWNIPPIDNRRDVVTEILQSRPSYKDINEIAETLGFPTTVCGYFERRSAAEGMMGGDRADETICIKK